MELLRFNKAQKYMIFDFETCSLNLGSLENKPWQLAFLIIENDKIKSGLKKEILIFFNDKGEIPA